MWINCFCFFSFFIYALNHFCTEFDKSVWSFYCIGYNKWLKSIHQWWRLSDIRLSLFCLVDLFLLGDASGCFCSKLNRLRLQSFRTRRLITEVQVSRWYKDHNNKPVSCLRDNTYINLILLPFTTTLLLFRLWLADT